jgi:hypothetical protein
MMNRTFALAVTACVTALLIGTAAIGQVETTPIPLPPKPNFSSMHFLLGTWNCVESNTRRPTSYGSTVTNTMDPSGYWMTTRTLSHATAWARYPSVATDKTTYDAANSRWVDVGTDNQGNYGLSTSSGFNGNTIVWRPISITSVSSGNVVSAGATTYTTVSSTKYTYTGSFKESGGRNVTLKGTCNKTST